MAKSKSGLTFKALDRCTVVGFEDRRILDVGNVQAIAKQLDSLSEGKDIVNVVLDFTDVEYLSSAFLGAMIRVQRQMKAAGAQLALAAMTDDIYRLFEITGLDKLVAIHPTVDAAVASL